MGSVVGRIPTKPGFSYRFNTDEELFRLDPVSGVITTRARVDRDLVTGDTGQLDLIVLSSTPTYPIEVRYQELQHIYLCKSVNK